jgi:DNA repair protein RadC
MIFTVADSSPTQRASDRATQIASSAAVVELLSVIAGVDLAIAQNLVTAIACSSNLMEAEQVWSRLRHITAAQLQQVQGITPKRAARILAALEFGKRVYTAPPSLPIVDDPHVAANLLKYDLAYSNVECFAVIVLNIKHKAIAKEVIAVGSQIECIASPSEIFRTVLKHNGLRCIVAHNHPSGSVEPSPQDLALTRSLLAAGRALNIPLIDHLILSGEEWYSFRQQTNLWEELPQED